MDDSEFNLEHFAKLFDAALTSDTPSVKKALRNFMMVASLVEAYDSEDAPEGPFRRLLLRIDSLERTVIQLQQQLMQQETRTEMHRKYKEQYPTLSSTWTSAYINDYDINDLMKGLGKGSV